MEAGVHEEVVALGTEVPRRADRRVAGPKPASALLGLLRTEAADELDMAVEEQRNRLGGVAVVEEPRSGAAGEAGVGDLIRWLLEPVVLDHAGLERGVLAARNRRAAVTGGQGVRCGEALSVQRGGVALEDLRVVHRSWGPAVRALFNDATSRGELRGRREVLGDGFERNSVLRRVQDWVVELVVEVGVESLEAGETPRSVAVVGGQVHREIDHDVAAARIRNQGALAAAEEVAPDAVAVIAEQKLRRAGDLRDVLTAVAVDRAKVVRDAGELAIAPVSGVDLVGRRKILEVRERLGDKGLVAALLHCWKQQRDEESDDRHDDEELDDREAALAVLVSHVGLNLSAGCPANGRLSSAIAPSDRPRQRGDGCTPIR